MEVLETIEKGTELPEMEEILAVRPESTSNEQEMENLDVKDGQEDDSRLEEMCTHPPEVPFQYIHQGKVKQAYHLFHQTALHCYISHIV